MRHSLMLFSAIALLAVSAGAPAQAQKLDANGQFAKAEVCGGFSAAVAKLDSNGKCRDAAGHFAKAEICGGGGSVIAKSGGSMMAKPGGAMTAGNKPSNSVAPAATATTRAKIPERCKNDKGQFAKCGSKGSHPA